jgi:hypothetical protein
MAVNINHATDTITASSGTLTLPNFSGGGGGGLTHFAESESTTSPNGTVAVDALTATDAGRSNIDVAFVAKGTGATLAQVPDGANAGGNKRGEYATDFQKARFSASAAATGNYSSILGGTNNSAGGYGSATIGGQSNSSSGQVSIAGGNNCGASNFAAVSLGYYNFATANYSVCIGGYFNTASGDRAITLGGQDLLANSEASVVLGGTYGTTRGIVGYCVTPASSNPLNLYLKGASQSATLVLAGQTSSYSSAILKSDTNSLSASNQLTLPVNCAYSVRGQIIASKPYGGETARWTFEVALKCGAEGTISLLSPSALTKTHDDSSTGSWGAYLSTNSTFNCLEVNVYGANDIVRWVCKLETVELGYY